MKLCTIIKFSVKISRTLLRNRLCYKDIPKMRMISKVVVSIQKENLVRDRAMISIYLSYANIKYNRPNI